MPLFGTDGIRAPFGEYPLDRETVTRLGVRLSEMLRHADESPLVILGGDTRDSTPHICSWLSAGLASAGSQVRYGGVLPTPAVARLVVQLGAAAGIAVSASHNPHPDNGIKLFDEAGWKWDPARERELEELLLASNDQLPDAVNQIRPDAELSTLYESALRELADPGEPLRGLKIVLDAANGSASPIAGPLFGSLGAEVIVIADQPDGRNINLNAGSTSAAAMLQATQRHRADLGIAFDGDADRAIFCDETGELRDGDATLFLLARQLSQAGKLQPPTIVATSMSNLGLEQALVSDGVEVVRCDVGDRTVVATMQREQIRLGGEQSGHIIDLELSTTGDGLITALKLAHLLQRSGRTMSCLLESFKRFPQVLENVRVSRKPDLSQIPRIAELARQVEETLGSSGRLVLRYSGTEPLARVMIEGPMQNQIEALAAQLVEAIELELGTE